MQELKFELTNETKVNAWGVTLFRIKAKVSFKNIKKGELGGWVESEKLANGNARVSGNAWVYGDAEVYGNALVSGSAEVCGNARVYGDARVFGDAWVYGNAEVFGDARVYGDARVFGDAWVYGNAEVFGDARVYGNAEVFGDARVSCNARVYGDAEVSGNARVYGNALVSGNAQVSLKKAYTRGKFLYSTDGELVTTIIDQSKENDFNSGRDYKNLLVVGDYKIEDIESESKPTTETINIGGKDYEVTQELKNALKELKEV